MRRLAFAALLPVLAVLLPCTAAAAPASAVVAIARTVIDTTFKAEGSDSLSLTVGGEAMSMTFAGTKQADGSLTGVFRNAELGDLLTTRIKVEGLWQEDDLSPGQRAPR